MGEVCICSWWTYKVLPVVFILVTLTCRVRCSDSPAKVGGKIYPRGNQWAVGHLMGKKSIESLPELHDSSHYSDYLTPLGKLMDRYERPSKLMPAFVRALNHLRSQRQMPHTAGRLNLLRGRGVEEDRDKYLREMSDLLVLALNLQDTGSS